MLAMARIDEKVGLSTKNRASQDHPPLKMKLPSRVERKCGEWCEVQSKTKKKIYYLNIRTKETTWKKPPGWCDKTADRIGGLKKSLKDSPSLSTDSSSQDAPSIPAPVAAQTPTPHANHHRPKSSPKHRSETPKHRNSKSNKHSSNRSNSRKRSPPRMKSSLSSKTTKTDSNIPKTPKSTKTDKMRLPATPIPASDLFDPLKIAEEHEKAKEERDREIDKIYSSKILKIQQLERRHRLMSNLQSQNSFPDTDNILRQHQHLVCESIPSRIQELVYNKKEKQADFYSRENSRNSQKTSECSGEIARLKHKLRSRSFLTNSVDGFCSLQRQRAEALMLNSFSSNFDSPERPTG